MKIIKVTGIDTEKTVYQGLYDISSEGKKIRIEYQNIDIDLDIEMVINSGNKTADILTVKDVKFLCSKLGLEYNIFPNGNSYFHRIKEDDIKSVYVSIFESSSNAKYLVCLLFGEIQPTVYEARLIGLFNLDFDERSV